MLVKGLFSQETGKYIACKEIVLSGDWDLCIVVKGIVYLCLNIYLAILGIIEHIKAMFTV